MPELVSLHWKMLATMPTNPDILADSAMRGLVEALWDQLWVKVIVSLSRWLVLNA